METTNQKSMCWDDFGPKGVSSLRLHLSSDEVGSRTRDLGSTATETHVEHTLW